MTFVLPELSVSGERLWLPTEGQLQQAEAALRTVLPPSYRAFALRYGAGRTSRRYFIAMPLIQKGAEWTRELVTLSEEFHDELSQAWDDASFGLMSSSEALVKRLVPFAGGDAGEILAWDPEERDANGEMAIYEVGSRMSSIDRVAGDLGEFLKQQEPVLEFEPRQPWG